MDDTCHERDENQVYFNGSPGIEDQDEDVTLKAIRVASSVTCAHVPWIRKETMFKHEFTILKVTVLLTRGTDEIHFTIEAPTPYPEVNDPALKGGASF